MKYINQIAMTFLVSTVLFTACKKDNNTILENPTVNEEELITTLRLVVTNSSGFNKTFNYKVDNGIGNANPSTPVIDNVVLSANTMYNVEVQVWNESVTPAEDITEEVKSESDAHLFLFASAPTSGAGAITFNNGSKDAVGKPFNQTIECSTGGAGTGSLTVTLKHQPTDKNATTPDAAGGETDAQAVFPVTLQ
ncbi:MAG: type 1 periplasmic binding fold superfamily protein [Chitinophagales bacterium]|nr:hypothetical protein [Chitinophagaceae bacterium]MCB9064857.1 type 1 periplasmic binding fold superfamily protein [Chitinophagales bacterium]